MTTTIMGEGGPASAFAGYIILVRLRLLLAHLWPIQLAALWPSGPLALFWPPASASTMAVSGDVPRRPRAETGSRACSWVKVGDSG